jgi:hypothetical protein
MSPVIPKPGFRMEKLWAFVRVDEDGDEGLIGLHGPGGPMPMVGADWTRVEQLKELVGRLAAQDGIRVELREFSTMRTVEVFKP